MQDTNERLKFAAWFRGIMGSRRYLFDRTQFEKEEK
jgi:hypothetical protein